MSRGGKRLGAGAKPGPRLSDDERRVQKCFRLHPNSIKILRGKDNASRYIDLLIENDNDDYFNKIMKGKGDR